MSSAASSIVDSDGNINAKLLTLELKDALESDVKYRQTDNMKKRAVRVAGDYNEFKNMVASAHLKKLTTKEVQSLSHVKKGWQRAVAMDSKSSAQLLSKEVEIEQLTSLSNGMAHVGIDAVCKRAKPRSPMEVERDLRRCLTPEDSLQYLMHVGLKRIKSVLSSACDADLIEQLIVLLTHGTAELTANDDDDRNTSTSLTDEEESIRRLPKTITTPELSSTAKNGDDPVVHIKMRVKWLKAISEFDKFDLTIRFMSSLVLSDAVEILQRDAELQMIDNSSIIDKYQHCTSTRFA